MKRTSLLPLAAAAASFVALAHAEPVPAVANPNAAVAPVQYQSVFPAEPAAREPDTTPDKAWLPANRQVAGMSETSTSPMEHAGHGAHAAAPKEAPGAGAPPPAQKAADHPAGHRHHQMNKE